MDDYAVENAELLISFLCSLGTEPNKNNNNKLFLFALNFFARRVTFWENVGVIEQGNLLRQKNVLKDRASTTSKLPLLSVYL